MSNHSFSTGKPGAVSLMEAGPVVEIHASHQSNHQLSHKDPYGRDGYSGPTVLPRQAIYTPPEFQFVLQDHNYWAPYPSTPPPRSPKRERLLNDHSYDEDWTKALLNSNALPSGRAKAAPNTIPVPREPSRGRGSSRGSSRGKRGGSSTEGRKLPPLPNMKNSGTTKLVPQGKTSYSRPTPPKVDLPSPRLPSPDIMSQSEIFARYKTPTPEPSPLQNGSFKDVQRLWDGKSSGSGPLPDPPTSMGLNDLDNDDDNSSRTSSAPERDGDDTETAPEAENYSDAVTRCVCNFDHDDGYMICCDRCSVWQHVDCMGIGRNNIPEEYLCELCAPRRIDRARARALQQRKRIEFRLNSSASSSSGSGDESDGETPKRKRSVSKSKGGTRKASKQRIKRSQKKQVKKKVEPKRAMLDVGRITNMRKRRKSQPSKAPEDLPPPEALASDSEKDKEVPDPVSSLSDDGLSSPRDDPQGKVPLASWIERYEEAVTNHYSPELRARIATMRSTGQQQDFKGLPSSVPQKCRVVLMTFNKKGLVCNVPVSANQALIEFRGKMMLSSQFQSKPISRSGRTPVGGVDNPYVRYYNVSRDMEICVDSRTYGNDARYVQQSCSPNAEIRHVIEKGLLHLYIVSLRTLDKNEEIIIAHDPKNPITCSDHRCRYRTVKEPVTNNNTELAVERAERARRRRRQTATTDEENEAPHPPPPHPPPRTKKEEATPVKEIATGRALSAVQATPATASKRRRKNTEVESEDEIEEDKRRRRHTESDHGEGRKRTKSEVEQQMESDKKLSREDRKMEAIMKAFERMEKLQAKGGHKPSSTPHQSRTAKIETKERSDTVSPSPGKSGRRGGRRGGRQRRLSGKKRFVSGSDVTSQEENDEDEEKSPRDRHEFKCPTNKKEESESGPHDAPNSQGTASVPSQYIRAAKSPSRPGQTKRPSFSSILSIAPAEGGSAKKRWLRQAISEEAEDGGSVSVTPGASGSSTPVAEGYGAGEAFDYQTPLKKRRFALSSMTGTPLASPVSPEASSHVPASNSKELSPASKALAFLDALEGIDMKQVQNVKKEIRFDIEEPNSTMPETFLEKDESKDDDIVDEENVEIVKKENEPDKEKNEYVDVEGVEAKVDDKDYVDVEGVEASEEKIDDSILGRVRLEKAITDENVDVENDLEETDGKGPMFNNEEDAKVDAKELESEKEVPTSKGDCLSEGKDTKEKVEPVPEEGEEEAFEVVKNEVISAEVASAKDVNNAKDVPDSGLEGNREMSMSPISEDATPPSSPAPISEPRTPLQDEPDDPLSPRRNLGVKILPSMDFSLPPSPPPPDFSFMKNVQEWEDTYAKKEDDSFAATPEPPVLEKEVVEEQKPKKKLSISEYRRRKHTSVSEEGTPTPEEAPPVLTLPTPPGEMTADDSRPIPTTIVEEDVAAASNNSEESGSESSSRDLKKDPCQERTRRGFFLRVRDATPPASTSKPGKGPPPQPVPKGKWFTSTPRTQLIAPPPKPPVISMTAGAKINFPFPVRFNTPPNSEANKGVTRGYSAVTPMKLLKFPSLRPQNGVDRSVAKDKKGGKPS